MKTSVPGVRSYEQNGVTKYQSELWINGAHYQKRGFLNFEDAVQFRKNLEAKYLPQKMIKVDSKAVVKTYQKTESIRETALIHEISRIKVRKLLITEGVYSTPESIKVNELLNEGFSSSEVAQKLSISIGSVNNLSAYRKGEHNSKEPTRSAVNARKWHEKNKPPTF